MITVQVDELDLINMLMTRVEAWIKDIDSLDLYEQYYTELVEEGCFDGVELNVNVIVDNDCVNNLVVIPSEEFEDYNIENKNDDRIVASNKDKDLYLIRTY